MTTTTLKACSQITTASTARVLTEANRLAGFDLMEIGAVVCDESNFRYQGRCCFGYISDISAPDDVAIVWSYGRPDIYDHAAAERWEKGNVNPCH